MFLVLQAQISYFKSNLQRNLRKQICELKRASGSQRLQLAPSKLSIKIPMLGRKRTSRLTVKGFSVLTATDTFSTNRNLFANKSQKKGEKGTPTPTPAPTPSRRFTDALNCIIKDQGYTKGIKQLPVINNVDI